MYQKPMLKEGSLKDQVIVVTGGGSGLGKAMTSYFLELGAHCVITSRNIEKLKNTAKEFDLPYHEYSKFRTALRSHLRFLKLLGKGAQISNPLQL